MPCTEVVKQCKASLERGSWLTRLIIKRCRVSEGDDASTPRRDKPVAMWTVPRRSSRGTVWPRKAAGSGGRDLRKLDDGKNRGGSSRPDHEQLSRQSEPEPRLHSYTAWLPPPCSLPARPARAPHGCLLSTGRRHSRRSSRPLGLQGGHPGILPHPRAPQGTQRLILSSCGNSS